MKVSESSKLLNRQFEGFRSVSDDKDGTWTIGFGNTFYEDGTRVKQGETITLTRAIQLHNNIIDNFFGTRVFNLLKVKVNQSQFDALVLFTYNVGINNLKNSTLLKKVNNNPNDSSITDEFKKWVYSGGKKLNGLVTRRAKEAALYFSQVSNLTIPTSTIILIIGIIILIIINKSQNDEKEK